MAEWPYGTLLLFCIQQHTKHSFCIEFSELLNKNMISAFWSRIREFFTICEKLVKFSQWESKELLSWKLSIESQNYMPELFLDQLLMGQLGLASVDASRLFTIAFVKISPKFHKFHVRVIWAELVALGTFLRPPYVLWPESETFRESPLPSISTEPYCYDLWKIRENFTMHLYSRAREYRYALEPDR